MTENEPLSEFWQQRFDIGWPLWYVEYCAKLEKQLIEQGKKDGHK